MEQDTRVTTPQHAPSAAPTLKGGLSSFEKLRDSEIKNAEVAALATEHISNFRRYTLLVVFCIAQFLDTFNNSSLWPAIPPVSERLNMTESDSTWLISAFQLTFASFLLMSGRISDVYSPKYVFVIGITGLGILSVGAGFLKSKIGLIVFRALMGISGALTIPSCLSLIVNIFPEPSEQARALNVFGGTGAIGNICGLLVGALFVQWTSWRWVFWFVGIVAIPISAMCLFLIPHVSAKEIRQDRLKSLDLPGVSILTAGIILFIFAVTSSSSGWGSARVIAPLVISIFIIVAFFFWERTIPENRAAVPPRTWFYPNFGVLIGVSLLPYLWWTSFFNVFTLLWQQVYGWTAVSTAVHMLPLGIIAFVVTLASGPLARKIDPKWLILFGQACTIVATILLAFASSPGRYWSFVFPAALIGSGGMQLIFTQINVAIFRTTPPEIAGIVGACLNSALQLGSAVGIAVVTSIQTSVESREPKGFASYAGRRASFWFLVAVVAVTAIAIAVFYRTAASLKAESPVSSELPRSITDEKCEGKNLNNRDAVAMNV